MTLSGVYKNTGGKEERICAKELTGVPQRGRRSRINGKRRVGKRNCMIFCTDEAEKRQNRKKWRVRFIHYSQMM